MDPTSFGTISAIRRFWEVGFPMLVPDSLEGSMFLSQPKELQVSQVVASMTPLSDRGNRDEEQNS